MKNIITSTQETSQNQSKILTNRKITKLFAIKLYKRRANMLQDNLKIWFTTKCVYILEEFSE